MAKVKTALTAALTVSLLGIAACGDDDDGDEGDEPIRIRTQLAPLNAQGESVGEVLSGSTIGASPFCAGGSFADAPSKQPDEESVTRTFRCRGGTLTITLSPTGPGLKQSGDWEVVKGLADFEGLSGGGRMSAVLESEGGAGRETFTGTVTR